MSERGGLSDADSPEADLPGADQDDYRLASFGDAPSEEADEFVVRALERAQSVARTHGYTRSTMPSWGLDETVRTTPRREPQPGPPPTDARTG